MKRVFLTVAAMAIAQPAAAETTPQEARVMLADYGACIVKREPGAARDFVLSGDFFDYRNKAHDRLRQGECLPSQRRNAAMTFSDDVLRGAMAEALIANDLARVSVTGFADLPALRWAQPWPVKTVGDDGKALPAERIAAQEAKFAAKSKELLRSLLGECVARGSPDGARGVLAAPINTPAELTALQAVAPTLAKCLPPGQTMSFDRMTLRGAVAVAFYRLANAPRPAEVTR